MKNRRLVIPAAVGVAAVWFGSHAGAGFATGRQEVEFFVQFGWHSIWIGLFSMLIMGIAIYQGLEFARIHRIYDYKSLFHKLYAPYNKVLPTLWDFLYIYATLLGAGVAIAGASQLIYQTLHVPYGLSVVLVGLMLLLFTIFGSSLVRYASTAMAVFIISAILIVTFLGIKSGLSNIGKIITEKPMTTGFGNILWQALLYGAFQSVLIAPIVSVSELLSDRKKCFRAALYGFIVNGSMLVLVCIMLLGFFPAIIKESLPVFFVTTKLGHSWLYVLYCFILFFALISTGVGLIYGVIKRFETFWIRDFGLFKHVMVKRITIGMSCMLIASGISLFGLTAIVAVGYGSLGYAAIFLNIIPLLFIAPLKIRRQRKIKSTGDEV